MMIGSFNGMGSMPRMADEGLLGRDQPHGVIDGRPPLNGAKGDQPGPPTEAGGGRLRLSPNRRRATARAPRRRWRR